MATYLYRSDYPQGRIFHTAKDVEQAVAEGWVDAPGKCVETAPAAPSVPPELLADYPPPNAEVREDLGAKVGSPSGRKRKSHDPDR